MNIRNNAVGRYTNTPCGRLLAACEQEFGQQLTKGEQIDLLLDNFYQITDVAEAEELVRAVVRNNTADTVDMT